MNNPESFRGCGTPATAVDSEDGYPAWIRTMNNASKGRCVTVTPRGIAIVDFRFSIADFNLQAGTSKAMRWLEESYQDRARNDLEFIRVEPLLDHLRGDPRFQALVVKVFAPKTASLP
jgi:hypothetical protein